MATHPFVSEDQTKKEKSSPKIQRVFGPKVSEDQKKGLRRKFRGLSQRMWMETHWIETKSLHHKLLELWFHMIKWCHPKMVTSGALSPRRRHCIRTSQLTKRFVHNITFNSFLFDWRIQNDVNCFYLQKYSSRRRAYMALYVRTPWLSVNSGTDLAWSGTRNARRQFRDCPGHSGTDGNPKLTKLVSFCLEIIM